MDLLCCYSFSLQLHQHCQNLIITRPSRPQYTPNYFTIANALMVYFNHSKTNILQFMSHCKYYIYHVKTAVINELVHLPLHVSSFINITSQTYYKLLSKLLICHSHLLLTINWSLQDNFFQVFRTISVKILPTIIILTYFHCTKVILVKKTVSPPNPLSLVMC